MDEKQAEAAANAMLDPERKMQRVERERLSARKTRAELQRRRYRFAVWFLLVGAGIGTIVAYFSGRDLFQGASVGAAVGFVIGWLVAHVRVRAVAV